MSCKVTIDPGHNAMSNVSLTNKKYIEGVQMFKAIASVMGHTFRGSLTREYSEQHKDWDYYGVVRNAAQSGCKAAYLIEHGFHTNLKDSNFLLSDSNLTKLAQAEGKVIAEFFGATKRLYRVQIGAFTNNAGAKNYLAQAKAKGLNGFVIKVSSKLYRVQIGSFSSRTNAEKYLAQAKAAGFNGFIVEADV